MTDALEELLASAVVNEERVLELVDEYQMLSFYLQGPFELRTPMHSPFRVDERKSFSLFRATKAGVCEFLWKDSGSGKVGNIFHLVQHLYSLPSKREVFMQIDRDFQLALFEGNTCECPIPPKPHYERPPDKGRAQIRTKSKPWTKEGLHYWEEYGVSREILDLYQTKEFSYYWTQPDQQYPYTPRGLAFQYEIGNRKKLYQPHNPDCKFLTSYEEWMVEGWLQLPKGQLDLLIVTKSTKDIKTLRGMGYFAVAPRSESTPILPTQLNLIGKKAKRVVTFFDNDVGKPVNAGQVHVQQYSHLGWDNIFIPDFLASSGKDPSDQYKAHGRTHTVDLLNQLLTNGNH